MASQTFLLTESITLQKIKGIEAERPTDLRCHGNYTNTRYDCLGDESEGGVVSQESV